MRPNGREQTIGAMIARDSSPILEREAKMTKALEYKKTLSFLAFLVLAGCGSDSVVGPMPGPVAVGNTPPAITSSSSIDVAENTSGTIYTATASDPEGGVLTFSIAGDDASSFTVDSGTGAIAFVNSPDFENPADTNADNNYVFTLSVSDPGGATASQTVTITVTNISETSQRYIDQVFSEMTVQRNIQFAPGLFLDLFTPANDTVTDRPVMLAASGGGFTAQERDTVEEIARDFARRGYVAATIDYRVSSTDPATPDDLAIAAIRATHDLFAAIRYFRADAEGANTLGVRSSAIFATGQSAGALMAAIATTLDPNDPIASGGVQAFLNANGGVYGNVGSNLGTSSRLNGAMPLSGAILDLATIDSSSGVMYAAHEEFDPVVPCGTAPEGAFGTGLILSGGCTMVDAYATSGVNAQLFLVSGSNGHVEFTNEERSAIYAGAARLFFDNVISR